MYRETFNDNAFKNQVISKHEKTIEFLDSIYKEKYDYDNQSIKMEKAYSIFEDLCEMITFNDVYINHQLEYIENEKIKFNLYTKDFKGYIHFRITDNTNKKSLKKLVNKYIYIYIIEIIELHSFNKGNGAYLIEKIKFFADNHHLAIFLYDANSKSDDYYPNLGFIDKGPLGKNMEKMMVYKPQK
ncbi:hypothetical protein ACN5ZK_13265 (plasmid) [Macrococcoides bohemicum]|uniref:hypothetical protein n=1 Tax=Macrococcoides bohemicum TaxID=1903056 RepID=UPI003B00CBE7